MEEGSALRCNGCWTACESTQHSVATACQHLYCLSCCQTILESDDPTCPICSQLIQKSSVKAVHVLSTAADLRLAVAGQTPKVALEVAHAAIQFYNRQQALYAEYAAQQAQRKIARTQDQCRKKLQEVHNGYLAAKRKYQEVLAQKHSLQEDNKELQDKYNQKAMQDKKLKEGFARLQQENEALRQQLAQLAGRGVPVSLPPAMGGLGGGGGGRASRMGVLGMESDGGLGGGVPPGTAIGVRNPPPDPSPLSSVRLGPGADFGAPAGAGGGGFGYDTPANQPAALRQMHSGGSGGLGGGGGLGGSARVGRNMSGGMSSGGMGAGGMAGGGLLAAQLAMGGGGMGSHQALQNDRRQAMGLPGAPAFRCAPGTSL